MFYHKRVKMTFQGQAGRVSPTWVAGISGARDSARNLSAWQVDWHKGKRSLSVSKARAYITFQLSDILLTERGGGEGKIPGNRPG